MGYRTRYFSIVDEDNHECVACHRDKTQVDLNVHHIDGDRGNGSFDNLVALCTLCHKKVHHEHLDSSNSVIQDLRRELRDSDVSDENPRSPEMRKQRMTFSLSADVVRKLENEENMSGKIEELLRDEYDL